MTEYRTESGGFTLIELMITVALIGILAAIAYPSYRETIASSKRSDAQGALLSLASALERHFTETNSYCDAGTTSNGCNGAAGDTGAPVASLHIDQVPMDNGTKYYDLKIESATATTFEIRAIPTGSMSGDKCGTFTYTQAGVQDLTGNTEEVARCWRQ